MAGGIIQKCFQAKECMQVQRNKLSVELESYLWIGLLSRKNLFMFPGVANYVNELWLRVLEQLTLRISKFYGLIAEYVRTKAPWQLLKRNSHFLSDVMSLVSGNLRDWCSYVTMTCHRGILQEICEGERKNHTVTSNKMEHKKKHRLLPLIFLSLPEQQGRRSSLTCILYPTLSPFQIPP